MLSARQKAARCGGGGRRRRLAEAAGRSVEACERHAARSSAAPQHGQGERGVRLCTS